MTHVGGDLLDSLYSWDYIWIPRKRKQVFKTLKEMGASFQGSCHKKFVKGRDEPLQGASSSSTPAGGLRHQASGEGRFHLGKEAEKSKGKLRKNRHIQQPGNEGMPKQ
jgi:hypothetical protein